MYRCLRWNTKLYYTESFHYNIHGKYNEWHLHWKNLAPCVASITPINILHHYGNTLYTIIFLFRLTICTMHLKHTLQAQCFPLASIQKHLIRSILSESPWINVFNNYCQWYVCIKIRSFIKFFRKKITAFFKNMNFFLSDCVCRCFPLLKKILSCILNIC